MNDFFREIFEYHHHYNQKVMDQLIENAGTLSTRSIPLMSHIVNAHQIWNSRIAGGKSFGVNDVHSLEQCQVFDRENFIKTLEILTDADLNTFIAYKTSSGTPFSNSIRDILFHTANHTTHHRGQLISDLRQVGVAPIISDYIFFKR